MVIVTVGFLTLLFRLFILQILRTEEYQAEAMSAATRTRTERLPARRGLIIDRNGVVLARNLESHDLVMVPSRVKEPQRVQDLLVRLLWLTTDEEQRLRELFRIGVENRDRFDTVTLRQDLVSETCPGETTRLRPLEPMRRTLWSRRTGRRYFVADGHPTRCPHMESRALSWNPERTLGTCADGVEYVAGAVDPRDGAPLEERMWRLECPTDGQYHANERAVIEANLADLTGIEVRTSLRRIYPKGNVVSHLVGYTGQVSRDDLDRLGASYRPGDRAGRTGVERALEAELRGQWGERSIVRERTPDGRTVERSSTERADVPVVDGATVRLTLDVRLQEASQRAMRYHKSGAVVLTDSRTGEILALYSKPTFDPNLWSGRLPPDVFQATQASPYSPMLNKALTAYAPGSVYKLVTATAGLHAHITDLKREVTCPGYFEYGGRRFRCHLRTGHGTLDLIHSLSRSCDIYYYKLGEELGMDTLYEYATNTFGLGLPTGIEVGEAVGLVPTKEWHRKRDGVFMPGFTVSTAVGQKDIKLTPLQVSRGYIAVANGGRLLETHAVGSIEAPDGAVLRRTEPKGDVRLPLSDPELAAIREGFWRTVNDEHGTAFDSRVEGLEVSGKTGTAEAAEKKPGVTEDVARWLEEDHAWFAGYAPARDPRVVVVVFVEHGHSGGKMAGPVAMQVLKAWAELYGADGGGANPILSGDHVPGAP